MFSFYLFGPSLPKVLTFDNPASAKTPILEKKPKELSGKSEEENDTTTDTTEKPEGTEEKENEEAGSGDNDSDEYEDEEDSDVEFLIDSGSSRVEPPPQKNGPYSRVTTSTGASAGAGPGSSEAGPEAAAVEKTDAVARKGIELEAVGEWDGQKVTEVSFDQFEDKPWRKPGADITDYFNYGFDELTWAAYCSRQDNLRDFNPQKIMRILGANNPMGMQMMGQGMMGGLNAPPGFPNGFPPGGFPDMMSMGMFPPGMQGFNPMAMGNVDNNDDGGAYGGNVQGVAGVVANPHPVGHYRNDGNDGNNGYNNSFNNQWNNN